MSAAFSGGTNGGMTWSTPFSVRQISLRTLQTGCTIPECSGLAFAGRHFQGMWVVTWTFLPAHFHSLCEGPVL